MGELIYCDLMVTYCYDLVVAYAVNVDEFSFRGQYTTQS